MPVHPCKENLLGKRFGKLVVIDELPNGKNFRTRWKCQCDCGNISETGSADLKSGHTKSCGCYGKEVLLARITKHGKSKELSYKREWVLKHKYGLTLEDFDNMLKQQNNSCAICGTTNPKTYYNKYLLIDHCHKTDKIRGLLCNNCNILLGKVQDNISILEKAITYLKKFQTKCSGRTMPPIKEIYINKTRKKEIVELYLEGHSAKYISKKFNYKLNTVRSIIYRNSME